MSYTNHIIDALWDETPINVTAEANFIWSIANKLRGSYMPDKYGDVIIPMTIIRRFECALEDTKDEVLKYVKETPEFAIKKLYQITKYQFYSTSPYSLAELCNDSGNIADNFKAYLKGFSSNVQEIANQLELINHINKMDNDGCLFSVVKAFSELDLSPKTFDSIKMGYIFEDLIGRFYSNVDAGQFYTGRDIIKMMVAVLISEGCDDIFDNQKVVTVCDQACGTGGMLKAKRKQPKESSLEQERVAREKKNLLRQESLIAKQQEKELLLQQKNEAREERKKSLEQRKLIATRQKEDALVAKKQAKIEAKLPDNLMKYWDATENERRNLSLEHLVIEHRLYSWTGECGHKWKSPVSSMKKNPTCPICAEKENSIASKFPQLITLYDTEKNGGHTPDCVEAKTSNYFWWKCKRGHSFIATLASVAAHKETGCMYCDKEKSYYSV